MKIKKDWKLINITVIPAEPGTHTVYDMDGRFETGEPVIAWRIESYGYGDDDRYSVVYPITGEGDCQDTSNMIAVQYPNGMVQELGSTLYDDIHALIKSKGS